MKQLKITPSITSRDGVALEKYLQEISRLDILTPEQEVQLARLIKQGDEKAVEKLAKANLRFVVSVAKNYQYQGIPLNDLINEGNLGLIKAARRFDETRGFKFISYAVWWIRQSILLALAEHSRSIRLPQNKVEAYQRIQKAINEYLQVHENMPDVDDIVALTGLPRKEVADLIETDYKPLSLHAPMDESDESSSARWEMLADQDQSPDMEVNRESLRNEINMVLLSLPQRESQIVACFYGLNGEPALSLENIAQKFDLTPERVRQIKERAIKQLRRTTLSKKLQKYL
ncbi:MAG: sigma-70 family RNA polymerase sigma factor [Chitinophagales bacterium]|nr:sigma-70 family RNA polymerase sigma factor [Chitinophagales bacterium]